MAPLTDASATRRTAILDAAVGVFLRYGFKKTSMDDLARAAGLSRQGLYLHFGTKEAVFKDAVIHLVERLRAAASRALAREDISVEERILAAFEAVHGHSIGEPGSEHTTELLQTASELAGPIATELEHGLIQDVARLLRTSGVAKTWKDEKLGAKNLAEHLHAASIGAKHTVPTRDAYRDLMRIALRIVCGGRAD